MKVAFVTDRISRRAGGLFDACRRLAQAMNEISGPLETFGIIDDDTDEDGRRWDPIRLRLSSALFIRNFAYSPALGRNLNSYSPDVVHVHGLWNYPSLVSCRWRRETRKAEVIHPHGMLDPWALKNSGWKKAILLKLFERTHLQRTGCIRALCESELESIRKLGITSPICIIPNGIDLPEISHGNYNRASQVASLAKTRVYRLLYLGRLHPKKGLPSLIHAWKMLSDIFPQHQWVLDIAGWDENQHERDLQLLADQLNIRWKCSKNASIDLKPTAGVSIIFHGPRFGNDKNFLYESADAFILPSLSEGLPMVVLEAWANAKPVLMTPECNLPIGFATQAAISIDTENSSIVTGLRLLISMTDEERADMGNRGRCLVKQQFTWESIGSQMVEINRWLMGHASKPITVRV